MTEPKLRFTEFTDEWKILKLSDIADRINRKNSNNETDLPLTISSLTGLVDQRTYYNKVVASKDMSGYYLLKNGEFAYNKSYSAGYDYGSIKRLDMFDMGALSTLYICFSLKDTKQSDFIVKYFDSQKWYKGVYAICAEGARNHGLLNVSVNDFFNMEICLPKDKKEEEKILVLFASIDNVISAIESEVALWKEKKKGVMQKFFSQEVRFKKEDGSDYPEWTDTNIIDIAETYIGLVTTMTSHYVERGVPLIRNSDIRENKFVFSNPIFLDEEFAEKNKSRKHKINDIITVHTGDVGTSAIIDESLVGSIGFATIVTRLNDTSQYLPSYICWYYNSPICKRNILDVITGDGRNNLNMRDFNLLCIPIPCVDEQKKIADCLSSIDKVIQIKEQKLERWKSIKKGLLQQMFV